MGDEWLILTPPVPFLLTGIAASPRLTGSSALKRFQRHVGGDGLAEMHVEQVAVFDGLAGDLGQVQILPGRLVLISPARVYCYRPRRLNDGGVVGLMDEE